MSDKPIRDYRVVCYDQERVNQAIRILTAYTGVDEKHQIVVTIEPYKRNTSAEQQRTLRWWYKIWSDSDPACRTPDDLHNHCKKRFLIPLLEAKDDAWREKLEKLRRLYRNGDVDMATEVFSTLLWLSSTTQLNVTEMTSFMESVYTEADSVGITLPIPDKAKRQ
jgi:hypothetical protein